MNLRENRTTKMNFSGLLACGFALAGLVAVIGAACTTTQIGSAVGMLGDVAKQLDPEHTERYDDISASVRGLSAAAAPVTFEAERSLGGGVALRAHTEIGARHPDRSLQRYVNLVGRALARESGRPSLPYAFAVLQAPEPNAFSGPGGYVFITTGTLAQMENEAELAGVLAHEIAHVTELHMLKTYRRDNLLEGLTKAIEAASEDVKAYTSQVDQATDMLFNKGLDKEFEYEADRVGMEIAALAGYDPRGLGSFLKKLQRSTNQQGGWYSTHPSLGERISRLDRQATALRTEEGVEGAIGTDRFRRFVSAALAGS